LVLVVVVVVVVVVAVVVVLVVVVVVVVFVVVFVVVVVNVVLVVVVQLDILGDHCWFLSPGELSQLTDLQTNLHSGFEHLLSREENLVWLVAIAVNIHSDSGPTATRARESENYP